MAKSGAISVCLVALAVLSAVSHLSVTGFVPPPARRTLSVAAGVAGFLGAYPALADNKAIMGNTLTPEAIEARAAALTKAAYPMLKKIDWDSDLYGKLPTATPQQILKAVDKALVMGAALDSTLLKEAALAHHDAIESLQGKSGVISEAQFGKINLALAKLIAKTPSDKVVDVWKAFAKVTPPEVGVFLMSKVGAADAKAAFDAFEALSFVTKNKAGLNR